MVEFHLLTFPRFPFRKKEHKSYFGKNRTHDLRTSRCAAYLLSCFSENLVGKIKIFVQDFVPMRTALRGGGIASSSFILFFTCFIGIIPI